MNADYMHHDISTMGSRGTFRANIFPLISASLSVPYHAQTQDDTAFLQIGTIPTGCILPYHTGQTGGSGIAGFLCPVLDVCPICTKSIATAAVVLTLAYNVTGKPCAADIAAIYRRNFHFASLLTRRSPISNGMQEADFLQQLDEVKVSAKAQLQEEEISAKAQLKEAQVSAKAQLEKMEASAKAQLQQQERQFLAQLEEQDSRFKAQLQEAEQSKVAQEHTMQGTIVALKLQLVQMQVASCAASVVSPLFISSPS